MLLITNPKDILRVGRHHERFMGFDGSKTAIEAVKLAVKHAKTMDVILETTLTWAGSCVLEESYKQ